MTDWSRVARAVYRVRQHYRYTYTGPVWNMKQRLIMIPGDQTEISAFFRPISRPGYEERRVTGARSVRQPRRDRRRAARTTCGRLRGRLSGRARCHAHERASTCAVAARARSTSLPPSNGPDGAGCEATRRRDPDRPVGRRPSRTCGARARLGRREHHLPVRRDRVHDAGRNGLALSKRRVPGLRAHSSGAPPAS